MNVALISPHLDDALLSTAARTSALGRDARIITVFAGLPPLWSWPSPYDNACGFSSSVEAVTARQSEDVAASRECGIEDPIHLPFLDGQYGRPQDFERIVRSITGFVSASVMFVAPLGLVHPDHEIVAQACRLAARTADKRNVAVYGDLPSMVLYPEAIDRAVAAWEEAGWHMGAPLISELDAEQEARKLGVVSCYESQRRIDAIRNMDLGREWLWIATRAD